MTPSKEVAPTGATALGLTEEEYNALLGQQDDEFDNDTLQTPILKIGQPLTREVQNEQAEAGEFINTLTGEGIGDEIDFVVAYYQKGRFAADRDSNKAYVAFGDTIPEAWGELLGEQFVGTRFDEHPDAEETYKARVNNKEIEWGKGPLISTTHNYTGLALVQLYDEDGEATEVEMQPVRLSLQRTNMPSVRKINSLKKMSLRNRPFWDKVFHLSTERKTFAKGTAFLLVPKLTRDTTEEERIAAVELAQAVAAGRVVDNQAGDSATDTPVEPDAKGGLGV
jgi:hypothetical protein